MRLSLIVVTTLCIAACGGGGSDSSSPTTPVTPVTPADTQAPVITLPTGTTAVHTSGETFVAPTPTIADNVDSNLPATISGEVGNTPGTYTLTYTATDNAGNAASIDLVVTVVAAVVADTQAPTITLANGNTAQHTSGTTFVAPSATVTDNIDTDLVATVSGNVGDSAGTYTLTYSTQDSAGNAASLNLVVTVVEPVITPPASANVTHVFRPGGVDGLWDLGLNAFDAAIDFAECNNDNGQACPSLNWTTGTDAEVGDTITLTHTGNNQLAGFFIKSSSPVDLSDYAQGALLLDIKLNSGNPNITMKLDCVFPCTSDNQDFSDPIDATWTTKMIPLSALVADGLDLSAVDTGIVIWATTHSDTSFSIANIRFEENLPDLPSAIGATGSPSEPTAIVIDPMRFGRGTVADRIHPDSFKCVFDFGNWIYSAGVTIPAVAGCDVDTQTPQGAPTYLAPQVSGPAAQAPVATHRWWGSVSFLGEMQLGAPTDASYITPDPLMARVSNTGVRLLGIPTGLQFTGDGFHYPIPDPFSEVMDGLAVRHSSAPNLQAKMYDSSDGTVTVEWQANNTAVMRATFVHGSPYAFFDVLSGTVELVSLRADGGEKGIFLNNDNALGVWTSVAGNTNYYLVTAETGSSFDGVSSNQIGINNAGSQFSIALLPTQSTPSQAMINDFAEHALNTVARVDVSYDIDPATQAITVIQRYLDTAGAPVETLMGMLPVHWKYSADVNAVASVRSARGMTKFAEGNSFSYTVPSLGVLPTLPNVDSDMELAELTSLINEFVAQPEAQWNTYPDAYWSGKNYSKVAELIAIADAHDLTAQKTQLLNWLQAELEGWFSAVDENNVLKTEKYFVYDEQWNTVLAIEESFGSHQQLNDHHFHYGYFVRAATEVCRHVSNWCGETQYGPMIELLIRDYAAGRDDDMFPYLRHFDPANGFSWASGAMNFARGNNNESTSEAANAYGAMVLFGLMTNDTDMVERGMYLHAMTSVSFWQYWNNIDRFLNQPSDYDNFISEYQEITTSIIWGEGAVFSTWFSPANAHILGIQALPSNPLTLLIGLYPGYLDEYINVGLAESSNRLPSGLVDDQWRDIWWNIMALSQPENAISDYNNAAPYVPEQGETKAHTYHWIHTFNTLGNLITGTGEITSDYPGAMVFEKNGVTHYAGFNPNNSTKTVTFSDGKILQMSTKGMFVEQ